jgi:hypothetical protein
LTPSELFHWRTRRSLTLDEAAAAFRVARRTYAYWESGLLRSGKEVDQLPGLVELAWHEVERRLAADGGK